MKFRSLFLSALCGLAVSTAFTSCSDDEYDPYEYGSKVALPEHRGLVLNEGSYAKNNASISFFDATMDTTTTASNDLYFIQNKKQLGDTGQDIITEDNNIYVSIYGSEHTPISSLAIYGALGEHITTLRSRQFKQYQSPTLGEQHHQRAIRDYQILSNARSLADRFGNSGILT